MLKTLREARSVIFLCSWEVSDLSTSSPLLHTGYQTELLDHFPTYFLATTIHSLSILIQIHPVVIVLNTISHLCIIEWTMYSFFWACEINKPNNESRETSSMKYFDEYMILSNVTYNLIYTRICVYLHGSPCFIDAYVLTCIKSISCFCNEPLKKFSIFFNLCSTSDQVFVYF